MKQIKLIIVGVIMATLLSTIFGCTAIDTTSADAIKKELNEKYGKAFTVAALGDRYDRDTATAYVYADDNPSMRFLVRVDTSGKIIHDEYSYQSVCYKVEKLTNEKFSQRKIDVECQAEFENSRFDLLPDISVSDYLSESHSKEIRIAIIARTSSALTGELLKDIYYEIYSDVGEITLGFSLFVLSEENYNSISEKVRYEPYYFGISKLKVYGIDDNTVNFYAEMSNKQLSLTVDEINHKLLGGN